jgi:hypothetical protein
MAKFLTRIYNFEVLISDSLKNGSRMTTEVYDRKALGIAIEREIYEEFEGDIVKVNVDMNKRFIQLLMYDNSLLYDTWTEFGFRPKGISITDDFHIRLIDTM